MACREAGTTLASAILSTEDTQPPCPTRTLTWHTCCCYSFSPSRLASFYEDVRRFFSKLREGKREKKSSRCLRFLPPSFIVLWTPSTSYSVFRFPLTIANFRNFARPFRTSECMMKKRSSPFIFRGRIGARNKGRRLRFLPCFTSLLLAAFLCRSVFFMCVNRNFLPRKQNRPLWRADQSSPLFETRFCREFTKPGKLPVYFPRPTISALPSSSSINGKSIN